MRAPGRKSLGILLARGPDHPDSARAVQRALGAAAEKTEVAIFLMADGVDLLASPDILALDREGVRLTVCTFSAMRRGAPTDVPFADYAGQFQLAEILRRSDRFVSYA